MEALLRQAKEARKGTVGPSSLSSSLHPSWFPVTDSFIKAIYSRRPWSHKSTAENEFERLADETDAVVHTTVGGYIAAAREGTGATDVIRELSRSAKGRSLSFSSVSDLMDRVAFRLNVVRSHLQNCGLDGAAEAEALVVESVTAANKWASRLVSSPSFAKTSEKSRVEFALMYFSLLLEQISTMKLIMPVSCAKYFHAAHSAATAFAACTSLVPSAVSQPPPGDLNPVSKEMPVTCPYRHCERNKAGHDWDGCFVRQRDAAAGKPEAQPDRKAAAVAWLAANPSTVTVTTPQRRRRGGRQ